MMPRHLEGPVRVLALLAYTPTAVWVAWVHADTPWSVVHVSGAIAGVCALLLAVSYATRLGELDGPDDTPDQTDEYIERTEWDD